MATGEAFEVGLLRNGLQAAVQASSQVTEALVKCLDQINVYLHNKAYSDARAEGKTHDEAMGMATAPSGLSMGTLEQAYGHLAFILHGHGYWDQAIVAAEQALAINPDYKDTHVNLGMLSLARGDWDRGWKEYRWLWKLPFKVDELNKVSHITWWTGEDLGEKTLLITRDQGVGDMLMMFRYLPALRKKYPNAKITIEVHPELEDLAKRNFPYLDKIVVLKDFQTTREEADFFIPFFDLGGIFSGILLSETVPYLHPDAGKVEMFKGLLPEGFNLGICWAGSPTHPNDYNRSVSLREFGLLNLPGVNLISLQKGERENDQASFPVVRLTDKLNNFDDTAALIEACDGVITVDTSIVHLAGALGKATWMVTPSISEWRWMEKRSDTPWYPTVRLFRQAKRGDWVPVFEKMSAELKDEAGVTPAAPVLT